MSYPGPPRSRATRDTTPSNAAARPAARRAGVGPKPRDAGWQQVTVFGAGLALGIALGAGVAMLTAPQSGLETRTDIRRTAGRAKRMLGRRSHDAWLDLRDELRGATMALRRRKARRADARAARAARAAAATEPVVE